MLVATATVAMAQQKVDRVDEARADSSSVLFPIESADILSDFKDNRTSLLRLDSVVSRLKTDSAVTLRQVFVTGYGSPDGPYSYNEKMAERRAYQVKDYIQSRHQVDGGLITTDVQAEDWDGLADFVRRTDNSQLAHRDEILQVATSDDLSPERKEKLLRDYPADFRYLVDYCMPLLRRATCRLAYTMRMPVLQADGQPAEEVLVTKEDTCSVYFTPTVVEPATVATEEVKHPWLALKTNLLYDAVLIPNIGAEVSLGKRWTLALDWFYTWFSSNNRHRYWQGYGGYLTARYYLNRSPFTAHRSPFNFPTGHHLGAYVLGMTYDVEWGGRGYQAARFGFGGGVEYGYSKFIGRRLMIDFSIGIGFQDGEYKEYLPTDDGTGHYVGQATHKRHWFGPTKAEISLKWLIGGKVKSQKKGGGK